MTFVSSARRGWLRIKVYIPNPGTFAYAALKKLGSVAQKKYGIKV